MPRLKAGSDVLAFPDDTPEEVVLRGLRGHMDEAGGVDPEMHLRMAGVGAQRSVAEATSRQADQQMQIGVALIQRLDALTMAVNRLADVMAAPKAFDLGPDGKAVGLRVRMPEPTR